MSAADQVSEKILELTNELKQTGLWKSQSPAWVNQFQKIEIATDQDFTDWLQFVYLPNLIQRTQNHDKLLTQNYIVPQAIRFFGEDVKKGKLLRLLIELDALP